MTAAILGLLIFGFGSQSAEATQPGVNGQIFFARGHSIMAMNPDGTGQHVISTRGSVNFVDFAISPDGTELAFSERYDAENRFAIHLIGVDGTGEVTLTPEGDSDRDPEFSPDGGKILFTDRTDLPSIWEMTLSGLDRVLVAGADSPGNYHSLSEPTYSPGGGQIYFTLDHQLFVMQRNGSGQAPLTRTSEELEENLSDYEPSISPDGATLVFNRSASLPSQIYRTNRTQASPIVPPEPSPFSPPLVGDQASFSPDGTKIIYLCQTSSSSGICTMDADGSDRVQLTEGGGDGNVVWGPAARSSLPPPPSPLSPSPQGPVPPGPPPPPPPPPNGFALNSSHRLSHGAGAILTLAVPGPGKVTASGRSIRAAEAHALRAGKLALRIRPSAKVTRLLQRSGRQRVRVTLTYTPTGGTAASRFATVTLFGGD